MIMALRISKLCKICFYVFHISQNCVIMFVTQSQGWILRWYKLPGMLVPGFRATKRLTDWGVVWSHVKSFPCLMSWSSAVDSLRWLNTDRITTNVFPFYWCFVIHAVMTLGSCLFLELSLPLCALKLEVLCYSETSVKFY